MISDVMVYPTLSNCLHGKATPSLIIIFSILRYGYDLKIGVAPALNDMKTQEFKACEIEVRMRSGKELPAVMMLISPLWSQWTLVLFTSYLHIQF